MTEKKIEKKIEKEQKRQQRVIVKVIHCKNKKCKNIDFSGICRCGESITIKADGKCSKQ